MLQSHLCQWCKTSSPSVMNYISLCYILICRFMHIYTYICWIHSNAMNKRQVKTSLTKYTSQFICKGSKRLLKVCMWEGAGDRTETSIFWPPLLWPATLCLSRSPDAQPEALRPTLLGAGFLYCILSASSLDPNSIGGHEPLWLVWLSLPHLFYISVWSLTGTHKGLQEPLRPDVAFPTTSRL